MLSLAVSLMAFHYTVSAEVDSANHGKSVVEDSAYAVADRYFSVINAHTKDWIGADLQYQHPLYDFEGRVTSYLFTVVERDADKGYIIVSSGSSPVVLEATREGSSPYKNLNKQEKGVYVGPIMHYAQSTTDAEMLKDLHLNKTLYKSELKNFGPLGAGSFRLTEGEEQALDNSIQPASTIVQYYKKVVPNVADMSWYKGCSPTSFSNIVRYWDGNGKPNLVQSTTSDSTLIEYMADYMNTGSNGGTDWDDRVSGMTEYWNIRGYSVNVARISASYSNHRSEIQNNRPDIINVVDHPTYTNHDMTGVGFEEYQDIDDNFKWYRYLIVHDTWDSTTKEVYLYTGGLSSWNEIVKVVP